MWATVRERGTVNFIAIDRRGSVASAVTTSGWGFTYPGRVGDAPVIGAGTTPTRATEERSAPDSAGARSAT
ncbi:MAG TPA: isoaspartyl peptidase/L-asparaginase [Candidatus Limnocylindria bacterium]|nr:isoaspartyl peptidase/L-asparaginase [Candidatus Limnocylindria bacterium]